MDVSHILDHLNDQQREAVTSEKKHLMVLAGAGSGKTRVLVHKIAWEVEALRRNPASIMAVTFTNKAALEMRSRIEELLETPIMDGWVGTFHGLAHR
ncbi:MAG: DNA helicase II, partial [Proteobacteria bacterium]|nr:DNA helicase II [Pseudomonadota bacterium]